MTKKSPELENISSISGRRVHQLRKDAKQRKRKLGITLQEALNLTVKEQGLAPSWQRLMTRGTELFGKLSGTPYESPLAKSTVFMGQTGAHMSRLAANQWSRALSHDANVIDVFIDAHGDTLMYATVGSHISMMSGFHKLKLFSTYPVEFNLVSNLYAGEAKTLRCLVNALFEGKDDRHAAFAYLHGDEDVPSHVIERVERSKLFGLLMWLDESDGDRGFSLERALGFCNSAAFLLPSVNRLDKKFHGVVADVLRLCIEAANYDKRGTLPMRITVTGLSGKESIPPALMEKLMTDPKIQIILQTAPYADSEWQDVAVRLAEQTYVSHIEYESNVPASLRCTTKRIKSLGSHIDRTPVVMYRCGNLVDVEMSLACEPAFLCDRIAPPEHKNGKPITES